MDKPEAYELLQAKIAAWQSKPFAELAGLAGTVDSINIRTATGITYELETRVSWMDGYRDSVIIEVSISDLNWYRYEALSEKVVVTR